jgi:hypothetical protein
VKYLRHGSALLQFFAFFKMGVCSVYIYRPETCALVLKFSSENRYLDELGMAASFDTKVYCRQTFIGGNYGLLNTTTFQPNPDYYR